MAETDKGAQTVGQIIVFAACMALLWWLLWPKQQATEVVPQLPFEVAQPSQETPSYLNYPVAVTNNTKRPISDISLTCEFLDETGTLTATGLHTWGSVMPGERVSSSMYVRNTNGPHASQRCKTEASYE